MKLKNNLKESEPKLAFIMPFSTKTASSWRALHFSKDFKNKVLIAQQKDFTGRATTEEIYTINLKMRGGFDGIMQIYKILAKEKPGIIIYTKPMLFIVFSCLLYKLKNQKVKIIADYDEYEPATASEKFLIALLYAFLHRLSNTLADGIIIANKKIAKFVPKNKPLIYIPNAADPEKIKPSKIKPHKKVTIAFFGHLFEKNKQLDMLFETSNELKDYKFLFCGKFFNLNVKKKAPLAQFLGEYALEDMSKIVETVDILVSTLDRTPGNTYASNMKVFDYMCLERPIIVSDTGELKDYIHYPRGDISLEIKKN